MIQAVTFKNHPQTGGDLTPTFEFLCHVFSLTHHPNRRSQKPNAEIAVARYSTWWLNHPTHLKNMHVNLDHETPGIGVKMKNA